MTSDASPPDDEAVEDPEDAGDAAGIPADLVEAYEAVEFGMAVDRAALEAAADQEGPSTLTGDGAPRAELEGEG